MHVHDDARLRGALISVTSRDEETDLDARRAAFEAVASLFGSQRRATRAVERSLNSNLAGIRSDAARFIIQAAQTRDPSATYILARNLANPTDDVRMPLISAALGLIDGGRAAELRDQLLLHIESDSATDRLLAAELLEAAAVAQSDHPTQAPEPAGTTSEAVTDADASAYAGVPPPEPRLAQSVIWAMVRAVEDSHLDPDADVQAARGDAPPAFMPAMPAVPLVNPRSASDLLDELMSALQERELYILEQRSLAFAEPRTLQSIGATFGVTRERIRQIEERTNRKWRAWIHSPSYAPLRDHAEKLSAHLGSAVPILAEQLSEAADEFCGGLPPERRAPRLADAPGDRGLFPDRGLADAAVGR